MSIKVKYVEATIADGQTSVIATSFLPVSALSKAFLLPATSMQHCGIGDAMQANARMYYATADLTAVDSITFQRGSTSGICPCACWIVEFSGQPGDADEFVMRGKTTTTFALSTDLVAASSAIAGVADAARCVPFLTVRHGIASGNNAGPVQIIAKMDVSGPSDVNSFQRLAQGGTPTMIVYNVEFLGQTTVQRFEFSGETTNNINRDQTITSVADINQAWVYAQIMIMNDPNDLTYYVWLTSATNLRRRLLNASSAEVLYCWVLRNPTWNVQHVNPVDGTNDFLDTTDPQTETVAITAVDRKRALVIGHAGSDSASNLDYPQVWRFKLSQNDEVEAFRVKSVGGSEYAFSVVEFARDLPPAGRKPQQNTLLRM